MSDRSQADLLRTDLKAWHEHKEQIPAQRIDLDQQSFIGLSARDADLSFVNFQHADLTNADLSGANLQNAVLLDAKGLSASTLAGADLTNCNLPEAIASFDALKHVEENSKHARNIFLALIGACAYVWLTIATTTDVALITNSAGTPLPIINAPVPIGYFYWVAPAIILVLYLYLHFYMQSMWDGLGELPAVFPDGRRLDQTAYPWLLISLVPIFIERLKGQRPPLCLPRFIVSVGAAWWLAPITIIGCWVRYIPRHDWYGAYFLLVLISFAVIAGFYFYRRMKISLSGTRSGQLTEPQPQDTFISIILFSLGLVILDLSAGKWEVNSTYEKSRFHLFGIKTHLSLKETSISKKPSIWTGIPDITDKEKFDAELSRVKGASLRSADLRFAVADRVFLINADLQDAILTKASMAYAKLQGAKLQNTELRGANLQYANLQGANLHGADLEDILLQNADLQDAELYDVELRGANLISAKLQRAKLAGANLQDAELQGAQLQGANLYVSQLQGAQLTSAQLQGANLQSAELTAAKLHNADLRLAELNDAFLSYAELQNAILRRAELHNAFLLGANLRNSNLQSADLRDVDLRFAMLHNANLRGANLHNAELRQTELQGANLRSAYLGTSSNLQLTQLDEACGDENTILPAFTERSLYEMKPCPPDWDEQFYKRQKKYREKYR